MIAPTVIPVTSASGQASQGLHPSWVTTNAAYPPIVSSAPWAKLTIFMMPKIIISPAVTIKSMAIVVVISRINTMTSPSGEPVA